MNESKEPLITDIKKIEEDIEAEARERANQLKERIDAVTEQCKAIQVEFPQVPFVWMCAPMPGSFNFSLGGDGMLQLGLLSFLSSYVSIPMARDAYRQGKPESSIVHPNAPGVIPLNPHAKR